VKTPEEAKENTSGVSSLLMKSLRRHRAAIAFAALLLGVPGCGTAPPAGREPGPLAEDRHSSPFLGKADYSDRLGREMSDVLASHRFSIPWVVVHGSDASFWFATERFQSEHRFDRIWVHVAADDKVTASITPYQFGPSDWAILGPIFADPQPEADLIAEEIGRRLREAAKAARR
jgi:hypothetical protein